VGALKPPIATTNFSADLNLNAAAKAGPPPDTFSTSLQVYDSLGNAHVVSATFTKTTTANQWQYSLNFPSADLSAPFTPVTGTLTFDGAGKLIGPTPSDAAPAMSVTGLADGASDMDLTWNLFNGQAPRITQFSQTSATSALSQDGAPSANLVRVGLSDGGQILAQYSNGQQTVVGQVAMAAIRNPESLIAVGNSNFQLSARTALPAIGLPNTGGRGQVLGGSIEASTVDIAREFTNLIVFQRGYQANTRVISVVDQISQDTINLKQ
jgi:flagellar hook protein FlgE